MHYSTNLGAAVEYLKEWEKDSRPENVWLIFSSSDPGTADNRKHRQQGVWQGSTRRLHQRLHLHGSSPQGRRYQVCTSPGHAALQTAIGAGGRSSILSSTCTTVRQTHIIVSFKHKSLEEPKQSTSAALPTYNCLEGWAERAVV